MNRIAFSSPENCSHQLLFVDMSREQDQVPCGQRNKVQLDRRRRCSQTQHLKESQGSFLVQEINLHAFFDRQDAFTVVSRKGQQRPNPQDEQKETSSSGRNLNSENCLQWLFPWHRNAPPCVHSNKNSRASTGRNGAAWCNTVISSHSEVASLPAFRRRAVTLPVFQIQRLHGLHQLARGLLMHQRSTT